MPSVHLGDQYGHGRVIRQRLADPRADLPGHIQGPAVRVYRELHARVETRQRPFTGDLLDVHRPAEPAQRTGQPGHSRDGERGGGDQGLAVAVHTVNIVHTINVINMVKVGGRIVIRIVHMVDIVHGVNVVHMVQQDSHL